MVPAVPPEDDDALGTSCSNHTVFLNLSASSSLAASDPLLPTWMSLILFSSCRVFCDVTARCVRMSNRHLLIISVPVFPYARPLHLAQLELFASLSLDLSQRFCLCMHFILAFPVKVLSMIVLIRSPHSSLCGFCRSSMRCKRSATRTTSSVSVSFNIC